MTDLNAGKFNIYKMMYKNSAHFVLGYPEAEPLPLNPVREDWLGHKVSNHLISCLSSLQYGEMSKNRVRFFAT